MEQKSTHYRTLLRYIYQETSSQDCQFMASEIHQNPEIHKEYTDLMAAVKLLPKVKLSPERSSIQNILHYMRMTALETQH